MKKDNIWPNGLPALEQACLPGLLCKPHWLPRLTRHKHTKFKILSTSTLPFASNFVSKSQLETLYIDLFIDIFEFSQGLNSITEFFGFFIAKVHCVSV